MDRDAIRQAVLAAIAAVAPETDLGRLHPGQTLRTQVRLDSMDWLNVLLELHDRLGVSVPDADAARLDTLDRLVDFLARRQPDATAASARRELPHRRLFINGREVAVRPITPGDMPLEADFVRHLSSDTRYQRFMATLGDLPEKKLRYLTDVDQVRHVALVATVAGEAGETLVGVVRYIVDASSRGCEFSVALDDQWHGTGLAGILMRILMDVARARGLETMEGIVLAANSGMLHFARQLGFDVQHDPGDLTTVRVARAL